MLSKIFSIIEYVCGFLLITVYFSFLHYFQIYKLLE